MPHRRTAAALPAALALAVATAILTACGEDAEQRRPPPACGAFQVAEWDGDGWECEPDADRNGVDDEDDEKARKHKAKTKRK